MLRNRIRSDSGATILLALLFFLLCALAGSVILTAGSAAAGRISGLKETEQSFYSITSAAQVMRDEVQGQEFQAHTENNENPAYDTEPDDTGIGKILKELFAQIYEEKRPEAKKSLTIYPSGYEDTFGEVRGDFIMKSDYSIEVTFRQEGSEKYLCRLTAKPTITRWNEIREETDENKRPVQVRIDYIKVYWNEGIIDKG